MERVPGDDEHQADDGEAAVERELDENENENGDELAESGPVDAGRDHEADAP